MTPLLPNVKETLRGMWQGRWVGLVVAWLAGLAGATFIFFTPDKYEATARVYVDTQSILKPLLAGLTVQPNVDQEVAILSRTLISRPNLQKLVRMTDMDLRVRGNEQREHLIEELSKKLAIKSLGRDNLYTITYTDANTQQAVRVVQSLLSIFVESGLSAKNVETGQAKRFIEEQIKSYEQRLTEAENRLKEFKLQNMDLNAPAGGDFFNNMASLSENLNQARQQLQEATRARDSLKQQMTEQQDEQPPSLLGDADSAPSGSTPEADARLMTLNKNLDDMLLRYTDNHPDVINTRRIIKEVETQRAEERQRLAQERRKGGGGSVNPVYAPLKMALAQAEAQLAAMQARVKDFERREGQLRERARSVPEREAQFAALNRDYAVHKRNYDNLVARREAAQISGDVESATGVAAFRIIDPPRVSPNPVAPNRQMMMPLALLAALAAGIGATYLFSLLHPTVHDNRALRRVGNRPVLGGVSLVLSPQVLTRRRRSALLFLGGVGGVAATYSAAIAAVFLRGMLPF